MRQFSERQSDSLEWVQRKARPREFDLVSGGTVFASLRWQKRCGSLAMAGTAGGAWTFKRSGFLRTRITSRRANSETASSVFTPGWMGDGLLQLETGQQFRWARKGLWKPTWTFFDSTEKAVVTFTANRGLRKPGAYVRIQGTAKSLPVASFLSAVIAAVAASS